MNFSTAFLEAASTIASRPWRFTAAVLAFSTLLLMAAIPDALTLGRAQRSYEEGVKQGAAVLILTSADGAVDAATCLRLSSVSTVRAAGTLYSVETTELVQAPGTSYRLASVSGDFHRVLDPLALPSAGLLVGEGLSGETSVRAGSYLEYGNGGVGGTVVGVLAESARTSGKSRWIFEVVPTRSEAQECWIDSDPSSLNTLRMALPSFFSDEPGLRIASPVPASLDSITSEARSRFTGWLWTISAALAFAAALLLIWTRRHELALYLVTGFPRGTVVSIAVIEFFIITSSAVVVSSATAFASVSALGLLTSVAQQAVVVDIFLASSATLTLCTLAAILSLPADAARSVRARD